MTTIEELTAKITELTGSAVALSVSGEDTIASVFDMGIDGAIVNGSGATVVEALNQLIVNIRRRDHLWAMVKG